MEKIDEIKNSGLLEFGLFISFVAYVAMMGNIITSTYKTERDKIIETSKPFICQFEHPKLEDIITRRAATLAKLSLPDLEFLPTYIPEKKDFLYVRFSKSTGLCYYNNNPGVLFINNQINPQFQTNGIKIIETYLENAKNPNCIIQNDYVGCFPENKNKS